MKIKICPKQAEQLLIESCDNWSEDGARVMIQYLFDMEKSIGAGPDIDLDLGWVNESFREYASESEWAAMTFGDIYETLSLPEGSSEEVIKESVREFIDAEGGTVLDVDYSCGSKGLIVGQM